MARLPQAPGLLPMVSHRDLRNVPPSLEQILARAGQHAPDPLDVRERTLQRLQRGGPLGGLVPTHAHTRLTPQQLWGAYQENDEVRACIDLLIRKVATWERKVQVKIDYRRGSEYDLAKKQARELNRAIQAPNTDGETLTTILQKWVKDILLYDHGVLQKVFDDVVVTPTRGIKPSKVSVMTELVAGRAVETYPVYDENGYLKGWTRLDYLGDAWLNGFVMYEPAIHDRKGVMMTKRQIVAMSLFPDTSTPAGTPLIGTLVQQIGVILKSNEHLYRAFSSYEIPPGLLFLTGVSLDDKASKEGLDSLRNYNTEDRRLKILASPETGGQGQWLEFGHTPKEVGYAEVLTKVSRAIYRTFGIPSAVMGDTEALQREQPTEVNSNHLVVLLLDKVEEAINLRIIPEMLLRYGYDATLPLVEFVFDRDQRLTPAERRDRASGLSTLTIHGVVTINEARQEIGYDPVDYGDIPRANGVPMVLIDKSGTYVVPTPGGGTTPVEGPGGAAPGTPEAEGAAVDQNASQNEDATKDSPGAPTRAVALATRADVSAWEDLPDEELRLDLAALGLVILAFDDALLSSWDGTADRIRREVQRAAPGMRGPAAARAIDGMLAEWEAISPRFYQRAARIGRDSARAIGGGDFDARAFAQDYAEKVTGYYDDLAADLQAKARAEIDRAESANLSAADVGAAVAVAFGDRAARVENWSGKLLEVASVVMASSLLAADEDGWEARWVRTKGGASCETCTAQDTNEWLAARDVTLYPGADTKCGAKCRCYYTYRRKAG